MREKRQNYDINQSADAMLNKIVQCAKDEVKKNSVRIESAIVSKVNEDGTVDITLPSDSGSGFTRIQNQTPHELHVGDAVEVILKNGSFNNCWIIAKHGANFTPQGETVIQYINAGTGGGGSSYILPEATATTLGGIKVGSGLSISAGVLSVVNQVTSVNGKTGAVTIAKSDVGLGNVDNVRQYSASNPPPYPVTSVNGQTGAVTISIPNVPVTSVNGKTGDVKLTASDVSALPSNTAYVSTVDGSSGAITTNAVKYVAQTLTDSQKTQARTNIGAETSGAAATVQNNLTTHINNKSNPHETTKTHVGLGNVDNVRQYSASNPPPYPVTSVNGKTGAVTINAVLYDAQTLTDAQKTQARANIGAPYYYRDLKEIPDTIIHRANDSSVPSASLGLDANTVNGYSSSFFTNIQITNTQPTNQRANDLWFQVT